MSRRLLVKSGGPDTLFTSSCSLECPEEVILDQMMVSCRAPSKQGAQSFHEQAPPLGALQGEPMTWIP